MSKVTCCYKCGERWVMDGKTCHGTCERYLAARQKIDEENAAIRKIKDIENYPFKNYK